MKILFNGVTEKRTKGCPVCGKRKGDTVFRSTKTYILPSGVTKTFRAGRPEEVSDTDGEFLLSYKNVFTEVSDDDSAGNNKTDGTA